MAYKQYPVFLNMNGRRCLVVGGGEVAWRKVSGLLECAAYVKVVSPTLCSELDALANQGQIVWERRTYTEGEGQSYFIVIAATDNQEVNQLIAQDAKKLGFMVNVVDQPEFCSFYTPSVVRRGDLAVAVSTAGKSPALAGKIRKDIEGIIPESYSELLDILCDFRTEVKSQISNSKTRGTLLRNLDYTYLLEQIQIGNRRKAEEYLWQQIDNQKRDDE